MIKSIIEKVSKAQKSNEGCYGYEPYLTFKSGKRDGESAVAENLRTSGRSQSTK